MIKRFRIQNYKALRDVSLGLTPIHVLIGPNDSGKTSILEAIAAFCRSVDHPLPEAFAGAWKGHELFWQGKRDLEITLTATVENKQQELDYQLACSGAPNGRTLKIVSERCELLPDRTSLLKPRQGLNVSRIYQIATQGETASEDESTASALIYDSLQGVHSYRWDGRFLSLPVAPDTKRQFRMEPMGFGLALCLDNILGYDRDLFIKLEMKFKEIFPHIKSIKLLPEPAYKSPVDDPEQVPLLNKSDGKGLYFEFLVGGEPVPARQVSDGVLLVLAYLAILHLPKPPRVLLIEEPENGIHPKRLEDVLLILRRLVEEQSQTQVVLTTHSPYVVDLFAPEEVSLCRKLPDGSTQVQSLSESQTVMNQSDIFTLGEIWTAEGDNALVQPANSAGDLQE